MKLAFVFKSAPHGDSRAREGLDALLAASNFCDEEDIGIFFIDDGIFNLLPHQQGHKILQKDFISAFKLLDLYDLNQRFLCKESQAYQFLCSDNQVISTVNLSYKAWLEKLSQAEKILTF